jgi:hypothetical protein
MRYNVQQYSGFPGHERGGRVSQPKGKQDVTQGLHFRVDIGSNFSMLSMYSLDGWQMRNSGGNMQYYNEGTGGA